MAPSGVGSGALKPARIGCRVEAIVTVKVQSPGAGICPRPVKQPSPQDASMTRPAGPAPSLNATLAAPSPSAASTPSTCNRKITGPGSGGITVRPTTNGPEAAASDSAGVRPSWAKNAEGPAARSAVVDRRGGLGEPPRRAPPAAPPPPPRPPAP